MKVDNAVGREIGGIPAESFRGNNKIKKQINCPEVTQMKEHSL